jgi:hypothetical protein
MVACVRAQPVKLLLALFILPVAWGVPAELLADRLIPEEGQAEGAASPLAELALFVAMIAWSSVTYGGQLQIAIDSARGRPTNWRRFGEGVRHTFRLAATGLPFLLPLGFILILPDTSWLVPLGAPIVIGAIVCAIVLSARTVLWAPLVIDRGLPLTTALRVAWKSSPIAPGKSSALPSSLVSRSSL